VNFVEANDRNHGQRRTLCDNPCPRDSRQNRYSTFLMQAEKTYANGSAQRARSLSPEPEPLENGDEDP